MPAPRRPQFVALYFDSPDHEGHVYGPESVEVTQAIERVDSDIGYLLQYVGYPPWCRKALTQHRQATQGEQSR